jgi:hypothetical protein
MEQLFGIILHTIGPYLQNQKMGLGNLLAPAGFRCLDRYAPDRLLAGH